MQKLIGVTHISQIFIATSAPNQSIKGSFFYDQLFVPAPSTKRSKVVLNIVYVTRPQNSQAMLSLFWKIALFNITVVKK